ERQRRPAARVTPGRPPERFSILWRLVTCTPVRCSASTGTWPTNDIHPCPGGGAGPDDGQEGQTRTGPRVPVSPCPIIRQRRALAHGGTFECPPLAPGRSPAVIVNLASPSPAPGPLLAQAPSQQAFVAIGCGRELSKVANGTITARSPNRPIRCETR